MHRSTRFPGCKSNPALALLGSPKSASPLLDFLAPGARSQAINSCNGQSIESVFYAALLRAASCRTSRPSHSRQTKRSPVSQSCQRRPRDPYTHSYALIGQRRSITTKHGPQSHGDTRLSSVNSSKTGSPWSFFDSNTLEFAAKSRLPVAFFHDIDRLKKQADPPSSTEDVDGALLKEQMRMLKSVRELEDSLARAKHDLDTSIKKHAVSKRSSSKPPGKSPVVLSRDDYKNLVDLYYHSMRTRFDPENSDYSPTPRFLEDYTFKLSEDFAPPQAYADFYDHGEGYRSPLAEIEKQLKGRTLREIRVTQRFLDLLVNDHSSTKDLFEAYQNLPKPGVAFLPRGTLRVFLQRMSTPWQKNEVNMLRYLSLVDDMQEAGLPITQAEWASAIYLAGRSFGRVTQKDVQRGFQIWRQMENEAGVRSQHVTFNILFDLAVRSDMYVVAQKILQEMHDRGLRLNRLGRVSVIFYHGLRKDGDAVRKAYRDFVDAGEIVDTLVLNCVIASLLNAGEPSAAEQIYERMKSLYSRIHIQTGDDGERILYKRYPGPGDELISHELASNHLNRVLLHSARLRDVLPEKHAELQESMPLIPDHTTFRSMISFHANVSGNLNRIVVLMNDMTEVFGLPFQSITFQLLFKGFALHGGTADPDATWSIQRLRMVWDTCRKAIKDRQAYKEGAFATVQEPTLPSMKEVNQATENAESAARARSKDHDISPPPMKSLKRLSTWNDFVIDLALFPRERRKHIERVHAQLFDEQAEQGEATQGATKAAAPEEQQTYYPLGDPHLDHEEGEYVLPAPSLAINPSWATEDAEFVSPFFSNASEAMEQPPDGAAAGDVPFTHLDSDAESDSSQRAGIDADSSPAVQQGDPSAEPHTGPDLDPNSPPEAPDEPHQVRASRPLVCWLLRAYARCTGSRAHVEDVYNSIRKVWRPQDQAERDHVLRVLRRCLQNCDIYGPPMRPGTSRDRISRRL